MVLNCTNRTPNERTYLNGSIRTPNERDSYGVCTPNEVYKSFYTSIPDEPFSGCDNITIHTHISIYMFVYLYIYI